MSTISNNAKVVFDKIMKWGFENSEERKDFLNHLSKKISSPHSVHSLVELKNFNIDSLPLEDIVDFYYFTIDYPQITQYIKNILSLRIESDALHSLEVQLPDINEKINIVFYSDKWKAGFSSIEKPIIEWTSYKYPFNPEEIMLSRNVFTKYQKAVFNVFNILYSNCSFEELLYTIIKQYPIPTSIYIVAAASPYPLFVNYKDKIIYINNKAVPIINNKNEILYALLNNMQSNKEKVSKKEL